MNTALASPDRSQADDSNTKKRLKEVELSIVIPCYLEEENLRVLLPRIVENAEQVAKSYEVLIIDTERALDNTKGVCDLFPHVHHIPRTGGDLYGDAIRTGIRESRGEFVVCMDADGSHSPSFIKELYKPRNDYDVVIASRYIEGGYTENMRSLVWMSWILNWTFRIVLNLKCYDVSNSYKLYRGDQLRAITLRCSNFDIVEEILIKLSRNKELAIKEIPFTFRKRMFGDTKRNLPLFVLTYVWTLIRLRLMKN